MDEPLMKKSENIVILLPQESTQEEREKIIIQTYEILADVDNISKSIELHIEDWKSKKKYNRTEKGISILKTIAEDGLLGSLLSRGCHTQARIIYCQIYLKSKKLKGGRTTFQNFSKEKMFSVFADSVKAFIAIKKKNGME